MDPVIEVENLSYAYPPLEPGAESPLVLRGVSLTLHRGECLALLGRTGAGKSTLCLTLNGIIPRLMGGRFNGTVRVSGQDTRETNAAELSQRVGLVFQDPESQLFSTTVEDEVAFGPEGLALPPEVIEDRITEALKSTRITRLRRRSPQELSGGQKQRVALAAALAMRPEVLVLDEPTASLDPIGRRSLLEAVAGLRTETGMAVLWVTQDMDQLPFLANRVAVLSDGEITVDGELREVLARAEELRAFGLAVPQMQDLAARFNEAWRADYTWLTVAEAATDLKRKLNEQASDRA